MNILTKYEDIDRVKWSEFIEKHPKGNVFQTPEMYDCYLDTPGYSPHIIICELDGSYVGVLLWVIIRECGIKLKFSARSIIQGAPLALDDKQDIILELLNSYQVLLDKDVIYTQIRNHYEMLTVNDAFQECGYIFEDHLNFIVSLDSEENIWNRIGKGRIKQIKKAQKNGLYVDVYENNFITDVLIMDGYDIITQVYKHAGLPLTSIEQIRAVAKKNLLVMFVVRNSEGQMLGCRFGISYKKEIYGWYAGSYQEYYNLFPNDILIWETLKWGCANGYCTFDYGGAGEPNKPYGVRKFKQQIGGLLVNYGRYTKIHRPFLYNVGCCGMWLLKKLNK